MQSQNELRNLLQRIDHKSYPAYKDTRGSYDFGNYVLSIDHVQGDPFAAPSKVSVHVRGGAAKFPADLYRMKCRRLAVCDYLLRQFGRELERVSFKAKGSGKSGLLAVSRPGQEVLERTACQMDEAKGDLVLHFEVGFPANGRTVNARELEKIFFTFLPECVSHSLFYKALDEKAVYRAADLAEDQQYIRDHLKEQGLVAFVADASILPRESGVSGRPMKDAVKFTAPESMKVSFVLPHAGKIQGMGIKKGITLIVGGGYHGKSTLLKALELGVYNHIAGDGREYVITDDTAMKIRAEDGRSIKKVDISMFINDLPNGKDTSAFRTEDASGSTSQAANVVEAMEAGAETFLIDEERLCSRLHGLHHIGSLGGASTRILRAKGTRILSVRKIVDEHGNIHLFDASSVLRADLHRRIIGNDILPAVPGDMVVHAKFQRLKQCGFAVVSAADDECDSFLYSHALYLSRMRQHKAYLHGFRRRKLHGVLHRSAGHAGFTRQDGCIRHECHQPLLL